MSKIRWIFDAVVEQFSYDRVIIRLTRLAFDCAINAMLPPENTCTLSMTMWKIINLLSFILIEYNIVICFIDSIPN